MKSESTQDVADPIVEARRYVDNAKQALKEHETPRDFK